MTVLRKLLIALICSAALIGEPPRSVTAQSLSDSELARNQLLTRAARENWRLRVVLLEQDTLYGRVRIWRGELRIDGTIVPGNVLQLDRQVTKGGGMIAGAVVGFVAGALVAGGLAGNSEGQSDARVAAFGGGAAGAVLGLFAGHAVAPGRRVWQPLWPMDR